MMRILHVVPSYIPAWRYGGPIHSVHGLCKGLAARGHEVDVATTNVDGGGVSPVPVAVPVDLDGVRVHYFPSDVLRRLYYSPPMRRFMAAGMHRWDIVHTHSVFLWPTTAAARIATRERKPYVLSPRGMLVRDLIARRSSMLKRAWIALFEKRNVREAAAIHVTSATEEHELRGLGFAPRKVFEIANGVDIAADTPSAGREPGLPPRYALFLGRISWKKGLDRLIDAMKVAAGVEVVVAGNDDENYWPSMAAHAAQLGVASRIHFIGYVDGERKRRVLEGAEIMVLPSYSENFGNAVLEAMAAGVPVIVTREVGLASAVESSGAGVVVDGTGRELGGAIAWLMSDPAGRAAMSQKARDAARGYSWSSVAEKMEAQYREIVS